MAFNERKWSPSGLHVAAPGQATTLRTALSWEFSNRGLLVKGDWQTFASCGPALSPRVCSQQFGPGSVRTLSLHRSWK